MKSLLHSYGTRNSHDRLVTDGLNALLCVLPCIAEEGGLSQSISILEIEREVAHAIGRTDDTAYLIRAMAQRLLTAACVLDRQKLEQGCWQFASFPAALLARHLISTLAQPDQALFPAHYWQQALTLTETDPASAQKADPPAAAADWDLSKSIRVSRRTGR